MKNSTPQYYGTGRRKSSVARVFMKKGEGKILINNISVEKYFACENYYIYGTTEPFKVTNTVNNFDLNISVQGGGVKGQANAICLGISRALNSFNEELRPALKKSGLLTRDPREVERKKVGFRKARKKRQFSKR